MSKLKVISFFAGPGSGKSTLAASLFALMKRQRFSVELVTEYAKDLTYLGRWDLLANQRHVLETQASRQSMLIGQVEWAITDSPLALSIVYDRESDPKLRVYTQQLWDRYENYPFLLQRTGRPYVREGRRQTLDEAQSLDRRIHELGQEFGATEWIDPDQSWVASRVLARLIQGGSNG